MPGFSNYGGISLPRCYVSYGCGSSLSSSPITVRSADGRPSNGERCALRAAARAVTSACSLGASFEMLQIGRMIVVQRVLMATIVFLLLLLLGLMRIDRLLCQFLDHVA